MIPQYVDPRQIASVHFTHELSQRKRHSLTLRTFDQLISLTVVTTRETCMISSLLTALPYVHRLSLWFDDEISPSLLDNLEMLSFSSITRLHIRCADLCWDSSWRGTLGDGYWKNTAITSFILDSEYCPEYQNRNMPLLESWRMAHGSLEDDMVVY